MAAALGLPTIAADTADTSTRILATGFHTLKVQVTDDFFAPTVLTLGDDRHPLIFSFDELADNSRYLRYSITHLDHRWQPSQLLPSEYAPGFNEAKVEDYAFSSNTFRHYVNYRITLPDEQMQPLLSGNYLLTVWDEDAPDEPVLRARFSVSEGLGTIDAQASHITDRGNDGPWQQVSFTYNPGTLGIADPFTDIHAVVVQNSDPRTTTEVRPLRREGSMLVYEHRPELLFPAGNEYRRFETTRTDYTGLHIDRNAYENDGYSTWLKTDEGRAEQPYTFDRTQQGRFKIDEYNATDPDLGADYLMTNFTLDFPQVMNGDVYVDGEFTRALPPELTRMTRDELTHTYTLSMLLKQGSYNYRYMLRGNTPGDLPTATPVEGDFPETLNEYTIYIYYMPPGARYARLLNVASIRP